MRTRVVETMSMRTKSLSLQGRIQESLKGGTLTASAHASENFDHVLKQLGYVHTVSVDSSIVISQRE